MIAIGNWQLFNTYSSVCKSLQHFPGKFSLYPTTFSSDLKESRWLYIYTYIVENESANNDGGNAGFSQPRRAADLEWQMRVWPAIGGSLGTYDCCVWKLSILFRNRSSSFSVGLPRSVCAVVNIVSVVMIKALANNIIMKYIEAIWTLSTTETRGNQISNGAWNALTFS